jgi:hypothetical protein
MTRRICTILASASLAIGIQNPAMSAAARKAADDPRRVEILYSENDALCHPLGRRYNALNHQHPHEFDWEDRYVGQFSSIGLRQPRPVVDRLHPFQYFPRRAYYRIRFPGDREARLVYVEDGFFGRPGSFLTNIWLFKPRHEYIPRLRQIPKNPACESARAGFDWTA